MQIRLPQRIESWNLLPYCETIEEALVNLSEATQLYLEEFPIADTVSTRPILTTFHITEHA